MPARHHDGRQAGASLQTFAPSTSQWAAGWSRPPDFCPIDIAMAAGRSRPLGSCPIDIARGGGAEQASRLLPGRHRNGGWVEQAFRPAAKQPKRPALAAGVPGPFFRKRSFLFPNSWNRIRHSLRTRFACAGRQTCRSNCLRAGRAFLAVGVCVLSNAF